MASLQKVQDFDLETLRRFKKSLICINCASPPRPGEDIYHFHQCDEDDLWLDDDDEWSNFFRCQNCQFCDSCKRIMEIDTVLTAFVSSFKLYNCLHRQNGCQEELEVKSLDAHERSEMSKA